MTRATLALLIACLPVSAFAMWKAEYADRSPEVQAWYATRELTPETQARLGVQWRSCCNHSDVVHTRFRVSHTDGGDEWEWLDGNQWRHVPPDTVHWGEHAPDGQPTLFAYNNIETCFFPAGGGI